jgi:dipeptidase
LEKKGMNTANHKMKVRCHSPPMSVSLVTTASHLLLLAFVAVTHHHVHGCTDILVTPGASVDGSAMISYNADSPTLMGMLYHYPATNNSKSTSNSSEMMVRKVFDWDSGVYLGVIEEAEATYNVVGNANQHGLIIGETTFGGVSILAWNQTGAVLDYGSLIYITLQRAKTAREAIAVMVDLMDRYGYASGGESFSLADTVGEVWMMEVISRGSEYGRMGAVWVAHRIPDGAVAAHANQARITTFPRNDPDTVLYADDVVDVAVFYNLFPANGDPLEFSFSDVYDPVSFIAARQGEARVWSIFSHIAGPDFAATYESYALGCNLTNRMPLFITPPRKLTLENVMEYMNSHYEGTSMDSSRDVGAGLFERPYRPRPLEWTYNDQKYHNERSIATAKTGWNFVGQIRLHMPTPLATVLWFACDDSSTSPRVPVYSSSTTLSKAYYGKGSQDGVITPLLQFDQSKAFWVQNMVSNFAYFRWNEVYPVLRQKIDDLHTDLVSKLALADQRALQAYQEGGTEKAVAHVSLFSRNVGDAVHKRWMEVFGELFVRFRDFYNIVPKQDEPVCGCEALEPGLSEETKKRIVEETGERYKVIENRNSVEGVSVLRGEPGPPKNGKFGSASVDTSAS